MGVQASGIGDLVDAVFPDVERDSVVQTQARVDYPGTRFFMEQGREGGSPHRVNLRVRETETFAWTDLFETTPNLRVDVMAKATFEAVKSEEKVHFDGGEEALISRDEDRIYDHIEEQYNAAVLKTYEGWDDALAGLPLSSADTKKLRGIPFILRPLAAGEENPDGDFDGVYARYVNGATTSLLGEADLSDPANTRLRPWAATIGPDLDEAWVRTLRLARINTKFRAIPKMPRNDESGGRRVLFMGTSDFSRAIENANASRPASPDGDYDAISEPKLGGVPMVHWPALDSLPYRAMFLVNTAAVYGRRLPRRWMMWTKATNSRDGVDIFTKGLICQGYMATKNPREAGACLHEPIAA